MSQPNSYQIERVLNNNVVIVLADGQAEHILIGKGIGFGAKRGSTLQTEDQRIEKRFSLVQAENKQHFQQLFSMVPPEVVGIAEEIITFASESLGCQLHEHIHVALADHIGFALTRLQGGLNIENPFLEEIRTLYHREWLVAKQGAKWISEHFGIPLPDEEVGFLTLHIHSATHTRGLSETVKVADSVNMAIRAIEAELGQEIPKDQLNYARMVIHLRFAIQRTLRGQPISNPLADAVIERLPNSYQIAKRAAEHISHRIGAPFPPDEISYLALHIARFTTAS
jgi:transcriptional antiterminator